MKQMVSRVKSVLVLLGSHNRSKDFDAKAEAGIFVGYVNENMDYKALLRERYKTVTSVQVMFNDSPSHFCSYHAGAGGVGTCEVILETVVCWSLTSTYWARGTGGDEDGLEYEGKVYNQNCGVTEGW